MIPQMEPSIGQEERIAVHTYLASGGWLTEFKKTEEFEKQISELVGSKYCSVVTNGTVSLTLALLAAGIKPKDEVIVPDLTMIATPNSAKLIGAEPIFIDVEKSTLCIDLKEVENYLTPKTKALIHVSFNGRTNDLNEVKEFCEKNNLVFIEDAAQSFGSVYKGKYIGTFGDIGTFSFSTPKIITTGQGGALVTDDYDTYNRIEKLKDFGRISGGNDVHESIGYNFKFTDLQAVIGIEQIKKLKDRIKRKKEIYKLYSDNLKLSQVELIETNNDSVIWFIDIYVDNPVQLAIYLKAHGIGSRTIYPPIHSQKAYEIKNTFPITEDYSKRGLWLPSSLKLTDEEIRKICTLIKRFYA